MKKENLMTPALKKLFDLLNGNVYFVGGAVRDALIGRTVHDIDLTTSLTPTQVIDALKKSGIRVHPTGIKHGTLTLVLPDKTIVEITSFRTDAQTDGRHAQVVFGQDIEQDAIRRDFTINALYMDADGNVLDFTNGRKDLKKRRLKFIGDATRRIEEDALRILRYFRFFAQIEPKILDKEALKACQKKKNMLDKLSKERVRDEMLKLLSVPTPIKALNLMASTGVLGKVVGHYDLQTFRYLLKREKLSGFQTSPLFRLWILCAKRKPDWPLSRLQAKQFESWQRVNDMPLLTYADFLTAIYRCGKDAFLNLILLKKKTMTFPAFYYFAHIKEPKCPFTSQDVADFFHLEGEKLGQKIKLCEDMWLKMECPNKKEVVFNCVLD